MLRFFLHIRLDQTVILDPEGSELPGLAAAQNGALTGMRVLVADHLLSIHGSKTPPPQHIEIADEVGQVLAKVYIQDVLKTFR